MKHEARKLSICIYFLLNLSRISTGLCVCAAACSCISMNSAVYATAAAAAFAATFFFPEVQAGACYSPAPAPNFCWLPTQLCVSPWRPAGFGRFLSPTEDCLHRHHYIYIPIDFVAVVFVAHVVVLFFLLLSLGGEFIDFLWVKIVCR